MELATLKELWHYLESMGGTLELVAQFPNRPPVVLEHLGMGAPDRRKSGKSKGKSQATA